VQDRKEQQTSKYHGVNYNIQRNNYRAYIVYEKKQLNLGSYKNEIDAAKAYNERAIELNEKYEKQYVINKF